MNVATELNLPMETTKHSSSQGGDDLAELTKTGYNYLKEGVLDEAEKAFKKVIERESNNSYALVGLGDVARRRGEHRAALALYQQCLGFFPDNNPALLGLADCYRASNQIAKALLIWEEYLKVHDRNIAVLTRLADAYRKGRNYEKSKQAYLRVLDVEQDNPYALIGLGHLHYDFKDYRQALAFWNRAYSVDAAHADVRILTSLGNCHRKLKTYAEGLPFFEQVLAQDKGNFYALFGMADCYRGMGQMDKSLQYWNCILENDPANKVILTRAGDALRHLGRLDEAEQHYGDALKIEFDAYAVLGLAMVYRGQGRYQEAMDRLGDILKNDPNNARIYVEMAECQQKIGHRDEALATLEQFQRRGSHNHQVSAMMNRLAPD